MCKKTLVAVCVLCLATGMIQAAQVDLQALGINAGFDDWLTVGNEGSRWASEQTGNDLNGDGVNDLYDAVLTDDEYYTNPSSFGSGWQSNGTAGLNGKYGLQHPKRSTQNDMSAPFNGDFIGFVNLDDGDGLSQSIQSGIVGALVEGTYTLTVAVGVRPSTSWNDVRYEIALVADPVLGPPDNNGPALGSRDGTVLGVPATVTLVPSTAVLGASNQDLVYTLTVEANDLNLGKPFAIRIDVFNALQQNGVPDDGTNNGAVAPGTNYRFVQGNFDNVRLAIASKTLPVPEPVEKDEPLVNGSFEEPAGGQVGFDNVPGWATDTPAANSGIKVDPNTTDGAQAAYLGGGDPAVRQLSSLVVEAGSTLRLSVDARSAVGAADLKITLFIELAGVRAAVVTRVLTLTESMAGYVLLVEDPSALVGLAVGVELANVGGPDTSLVLDNVTLR